MAMFRIEGINQLPSVKCVYKLTFGDRYFIFKAMNLSQSIKPLAEQIDREIRSPKEDSILYKVISFLRTYPVNFASVSIIHAGEDNVKLLMAEHEALEAANSDTNCLNVNISNTDYFPKWITQKEIMKFKAMVEGKTVRFKPSKDVYLRKYLSKFSIPAGDQEKIFNYVRERYR